MLLDDDDNNLLVSDLQVAQNGELNEATQQQRKAAANRSAAAGGGRSVALVTRAGPNDNGAKVRMADLNIKAIGGGFENEEGHYVLFSSMK